MPEDISRNNAINKIEKNLPVLIEYIKDVSTKEEHKHMYRIFEQAIDDTKYIINYIYYIPNFGLSDFSSWLENWVLANKNTKNNELQEACLKISNLANLAKASHDAIEDTGLYRESLISNKFEHNNNILASRFGKTKENLSSSRAYYMVFAILLVLILGSGYVYFFFLQYKTSFIEYKNHIMLIISCSPFIFLAGWLFWKIGHYTKLIDAYTFKENIGYTLKTATDYIMNIEQKEKNMEMTLSKLNSLLEKLYEHPVNEGSINSTATKTINGLTKITKELKDIVDASQQ